MKKSKLEPLFRRLGTISWTRYEDWDRAEILKINDQINKALK